MIKHRNGDARPVEPMLRINHTGYGIRVTTIVQLVMLLVPIFAAWWNLSATLASQGKTVEINATETNKQIAALTSQLQQNRSERLQDTKELQRSWSTLTSDVARLQEQFKNLQLLLGDIRKKDDSDSFNRFHIQPQKL